MIGQFLIRDGDQAWRFEWSDSWGANSVTKTGHTAEQPSWRSRFWTVTAIWAAQGKRTQPEGRETLAVWEQPPAATYRYRQIGKRSRLLLDCVEPSGFMEGISAEIWEAVSDSDGSGEADETENTGSARKGDSAGPKDIAQTPSG